MGSWFFVEPFIEQALHAAGKAPMRARYAGRKAAASPATGLMQSAISPSRARSSLMRWAIASALKSNVSRKADPSWHRSQSPHAG
jgi:2-oxoglutarate dehydrogenase E1 component